MNTAINTPVFFILGRARSGTTLIRQLLNNHSQIGIPPESPFIIHLYKKYNNKKAINVNSFINDLKTEPYLSLWNIDYSILKEQLQFCSEKTFANFCLVLLNHTQQEKTILGDKNPSYCLFIKTLNRIYPNAKYIWIIRDYRAQINSMLKVNFEIKNIASLAIRWKRYNQEIEKLQKINPNNLHLVKYEDLVINSEIELRKICSFLDIDYEQNMSISDISKLNEKHIDTHHTSLKEKLNTTHIDEWKKSLSKKQIQICEALCDPYAKNFHYNTVEKKLPFLEKIKLFPLINYGKLYIPYIRLMYLLPLRIRLFISEKIIYPNFKFWQEAKSEL